VFACVADTGRTLEAAAVAAMEQPATFAGVSVLTKHPVTSLRPSFAFFAYLQHAVIHNHAIFADIGSSLEAAAVAAMQQPAESAAMSVLTQQTAAGQNTSTRKVRRLQSKATVNRCCLLC